MTRFPDRGFAIFSLPLWRSYAINEETGERDVIYLRAATKNEAKARHLEMLGGDFGPWRITQARAGRR